MLRLLWNKGIGLIFRLLGKVAPDLCSDLRYFRMFKRRLNRKAPTLFAEKIMLKSRSKENEVLCDYVDKVKVRDYVSATIGEQYCIPLLAVYDSPREVRYNEIPEGAFVKLNHGCGFNVIFRREKERFIRRRVRRWYATDYSRFYQERQYKNVVRKIFVEENIAPEGLLVECSMYVFGGKVEFSQIRDNRKHRYEVGRDYEPLPFQFYSSVTEILPRFPAYDTMVTLAEKLAEPFGFVRVDWFMPGEKIYFGELTFTPGAGPRMFRPFEYNRIFGEKLPDYVIKAPAEQP